jgi:hypothetical protein
MTDSPAARLAVVPRLQQRGVDVRGRGLAALPLPGADPRGHARGGGRVWGILWAPATGLASPGR